MYAKYTENFDTGTDVPNNQIYYINLWQNSRIFAGESAAITKKFGVRVSLKALLNYVSFNHRDHNIQLSLM